MTDELDPQVALLSRDVVASLAPTELPLFNAISREYAKDPEKATKSAQAREEPLGFGVALALPLLTPIVITVAEAVFKFIASEVLKATQQEAGAAIDQAVHQAAQKVTGAQPSAASTPATAPLTAAQLSEVRQVALNRALSLQLSRDQAERLADAMVARLATHPA
jgi:hypothetical protein